MEYPLKGVLHGYLRHLLFFTAGLGAPTISVAALCVGASFAPCPLARAPSLSRFSPRLEPRGPRWVFSEEAGKPLEAVDGSVAPENS